MAKKRIEVESLSHDAAGRANVSDIEFDVDLEMRGDVARPLSDFRERSDA